MELETVRIVADWLKDPVNGVAALLPTTPRDVGDALPVLTGGIADSTRDGWVARKAVPHEGGPTLPALAVFANPITLDGEVHTSHRDGQIDVVIAYVSMDSDSSAANAAALYVRRTVLRSLAILNANAHADDRRRNSIAVFACDALKLGSLRDQWGDVFISDAIVATFHVRDLTP
jgi:hypothetical protein